MGIDTKAILRKGTTIEDIKNRLELKYRQVSVKETHSEDYFQLIFEEPESNGERSSHRSMSVFINKYAKSDYGIDGVLVSLGYWGSSIEIMKWLLEEFGGYLDENDCDDIGFYPINLQSFEKGIDFSPADLFVNKIIQKIGYEKLNDVLELYSEYKTIEQWQTPEVNPNTSTPTKE